MKIYLILILILLFISRDVFAEERYNYKLHECENFKIGDIVTYSFSYVYFNRNDFLGMVTSINPKPTTEKMHWIEIVRLSGSGTSGIYSEHFLEIYEE